MSSLSTLGVAVVGAGYWGPNLIRNFRTSPQWDLVAVCDLDEERARGLLGARSGVQVTSSLDEVLAREDVHAVAVATPARTHQTIALAALAAGKHVLVEKPLADSVANGQRMVDLAAEQGLLLMADHTYCYTPAVLKIRELVRAGELGEILFVDSVRINLGLVQPDVDVFWDLAPHDLAILDFVLPGGLRPTGVSASGADPLGAGKACVGYLSLPLPNGGIAHIHVNWLSPTKIRQMVIGGTRRTLVWDDLNPQQRLSVYDRGVDLQQTSADTTDRAAATISYRLGDTWAPALPEREPLGEMVTEFADQHPRAPSSPHRRQGRASGTAGARGCGAQPRHRGRPGGRGRGRPGLGGRAMTELKGARVLVTGGAGTIGSTLVDQLLEAGAARVTVLDNLVRGRRANLDHAEATGRLDLVVGDIRDRDLVHDVTSGCDLVFHQAAIRITQCAEEPRLALEVLVDGTFNVLEAAADAVVDKLVAASSASVYGLAEEFPTLGAPPPLRQRHVLRRRQVVQRGDAPQLPGDARPRPRGAAVLQRLRPADGRARPLHRGPGAVDGADRRRSAARSSSATGARRWTSSSPPTSRAPTCWRPCRRCARASTTWHGGRRPACWASPRRCWSRWGQTCPSSTARSGP